MYHWASLGRHREPTFELYMRSAFQLSMDLENNSKHVLDLLDKVYNPGGRAIKLA